MKILHLYYDIMNLYGDYGNVSVLERLLTQSGADCEVVKKSLGDSFGFDDCDFVFMGSGTERNQKLVLEDFMKHKEAFSNYIENNKPALFTGNSFEILGKWITDSEGIVHDGLQLFDYRTSEQTKNRLTADAVFESVFADKLFVGFINKCSETHGIEDHAFKVKRGLADNKLIDYEGIKYNNFIGTHLTGPVLVKNPHFAEYFAKIILGKEPNTDCLELAKNGYEVTLRELISDN